MILSRVGPSDSHGILGNGFDLQGLSAIFGEEMDGSAGRKPFSSADRDVNVDAVLHPVLVVVIFVNSHEARNYRVSCK